MAEFQRNLMITHLREHPLWINLSHLMILLINVWSAKSHPCLNSWQNLTCMVWLVLVLNHLTTLLWLSRALIILVCLLGTRWRSKRYYFDNVLSEFMHSSQWSMILDYLIYKMQSARDFNDDVDTVYDDVCVSISSEMDDHLNCACNTKFIRKKFKHFKPYWSDDLTSHWKDMAESEKRYKRCPHNSYQKSQLWNEFIYRRESFDYANPNVNMIRTLPNKWNLFLIKTLGSSGNR